MEEVKAGLVYLDQNGKLKYTHGTPGRIGKSATMLQRPWGVTSDSHGRLLISDCGNSRIIVLSEEGSLVGQIDLTQYELMHPYGITIDSEGHLLVLSRKAGHKKSKQNSVVKFAYNVDYKKH